MRAVFLAMVVGVACGNSSMPVPGADGGVDARTPMIDVAPDVSEGAFDTAIDLAADVEEKGVLGIAPPAHDYGRVGIGAMSDAFTFTVSNKGGAPLDLLEVKLEGPDFVMPLSTSRCGIGTLAPGASCTVDVLFKPQGRGLKEASLTASAGGQAVTAKLMGTGQTIGDIAIFPLTLTFVADVGQMSAPMTVTIANPGDDPTAQLAIALAATDANQFKLTNNGCAAPLPGSSSCTVAVFFAPISRGMKTATLTVSSPIGGMAVAMLTGATN